MKPCARKTNGPACLADFPGRRNLKFGNWAKSADCCYYCFPVENGAHIQCANVKEEMMGIRFFTMLGTAALFSVSALFVTNAYGDEKITPLLKQKLEGVDNMEATIALVEADPGWATERHIHPGNVFVYVLEGSVELDVEGQDPVKLGAGEAGYELPNQPMIGRNLSSTESARLIIFQVGEAGKELMIPQPE
jgi:quercetin dioxygenase-like cupin family protein